MCLVVDTVLLGCWVVLVTANSTNNARATGPGTVLYSRFITTGFFQQSHATKHSVSTEESFHSASELRISLTKRNSVLKIDSLHKRRIIQRNLGEGGSWPLERAVHPQH